jgi:hypothetical protein
MTVENVSGFTPEVFERAECTFNYCPAPDLCRSACRHPLEPERTELDADEELWVKAAWEARKNRTSFADELAKIGGSQ